MAFGRMELFISVAVIGTLLWAHEAEAQSSCTSAIVSLSPCLNYITGNSSTPTSSCCSQLASVVKSEPQCLCTVLNGGGSSLGLNINQTQALGLPGACNVQTPPVSRCNSAAAGGPSGSPASPSANPSGNGSKQLPSQPSSGTQATFSTYLVACLLIVASYAIVFSSISY
ncbi:Non-specific lipid-transfer protein 3 [Acorus calamus]|uniref:Non-specific lipid-transfer protein 3 n=1 Tax=Acorus calamus TaxID=4465 RepID=A0AAV9EAG9_ACOCL|nr:Non-specific lipid-transfer protein 3 [Acorus calamus]